MKPWKYLMLAFAPALLLAACGGGNDSLDDRLGVADPKVRLVHAAPLAPGVTLLRNDAVQADANGGAYPSASPFFDVETGGATWKVETTTGGLDLGQLQFDAQRGHQYSVIALTGAATAELMLLDDPYDKGLTSEKARVRVVNGAANARTLDVYLTAPGADLAALGPTFGAVGFAAAMPPSGDGSAEFAAGDWQLRITDAGTKTVLYTRTVTLDENGDWLFVAVPDSLVPGDLKVVAVKTGDAAPGARELESQ